VTTASQPRIGRGRRPARPSGDDREAAILETAERLLEERPLAEISVDDLARGAGISRPTFYFYFPSKDAVLLTLMDRVIAQAYAAREALMANPPKDRNAFWRAGIGVYYSTFHAHQALAGPWSVAKYTNSDARRLWAGFMQASIDQTTDIIEAVRARGGAPDTIPARELATSLNLLNEAVMTSSFAGYKPGLPDERVLDNLVHIWLNAIYGDTP
jgi:TetR/AcrR family transcriptional regulator, ethionamide resistance regulator